MAEFVGEKIFDTRITGPSYMVAEMKLVQMLKPAGLIPDRMRCEFRRLTSEGEFEFHFMGRVKVAAPEKET